MKFSVSVMCLGIFLAVVFGADLRAASWVDAPDRGRVGWYGYQKEKEPEGEKSEKEKVVETAERTEEEGRRSRWPTPDELYRMKPSEIKKFIDEASEVAIADPTEENVRRWIEYLHVAEVKASEFAGAWAWVMQQSPDIYRSAALYPVVPAGNSAMWKKVWSDVENTLRTKHGDYAILLFVGLGGPYDEAMIRIMKTFSSRHPEWRVERVDLRENPQIGSKLGINYTPQVWLLSRQKQKPFPLAAGPVAVSRLEKKIYHTIQVLEGKKPPRAAPYYDFNRPGPVSVGHELSLSEKGGRQ